MTAHKLWVVTKSPVDLPGAAELVGAYSDRESARAICERPGTWFVAEVVEDKIYPQGQLLNVEMIIVKDHREFELPFMNGHPVAR